MEFHTLLTCLWMTFLVFEVLLYMPNPFGKRCFSGCEGHQFALNGEKDFMVKEGPIRSCGGELKISKSGIEVDRAKINVIAKLPHPTTVKGVRSFLGHAGFYRRFIQNFLKIARLMTHLLAKETPFYFFQRLYWSIYTLQKESNEAPILIARDGNKHLNLCAIANAISLGLQFILGQRSWRNISGLIHMKNPHENKLDPKEINEKFPLETLSSIAILDASTPWFADIANYHAGNFVIKGMSTQQKKKNSSKDVNSIISGKIHFCLKSVRIKIARIVKTLVLSVLSFIHKSFTSSASFWESRLVEAIDSLVPLDEHLATFLVWGILETDIQEKKQKESQNQARNGKDKVEGLSPREHKEIEGWDLLSAVPHTTCTLLFLSLKEGTSGSPPSKKDFGY
ncbi:hypothetical protein Tco_0484707 [Tanacetum coccineum]